jgi:polyhydroxybutyrate depolymerase
MWRILLLATVLGVLAPASYADVVIDIGGRTVNVHVPASYHPLTPAAVVVLLHGYTSTGAIQESYMHFEPLADEKGFLYLHPDGTACGVDPFWNATDACCDFCGSSVDDVAFLSDLLDAVEAQFSVDPGKIYLIGHSNGGFMSYRMACEHADRIAAIASLAGATWSDPTRCSPSEPIHTLQIHGTLDDTIFYTGGSILGVPYPGALATVEAWATYNGCSLTPDTSSPNLDLEANLPGDETRVARYPAGCAVNGSAELWTIVAGSHVPALSSDFSREVVDYLLAHPKSATTVSVAALDDRRGLIVVIAAVGFAVALHSVRSKSRAAPSRVAEANARGRPIRRGER